MTDLNTTPDLSAFSSEVVKISEKAIETDNKAECLHPLLVNSAWNSWVEARNSVNKKLSVGTLDDFTKAIKFDEDSNIFEFSYLGAALRYDFYPEYQTSNNRDIYHFSYYQGRNSHSSWRGDDDSDRSITDWETSSNDRYVLTRKVEKATCSITLEWRPQLSPKAISLTFVGDKRGNTFDIRIYRYSDVEIKNEVYDFFFEQLPLLSRPYFRNDNFHRFKLQRYQIGIYSLDIGSYSTLNGKKIVSVNFTQAEKHLWSLGQPLSTGQTWTHWFEPIFLFDGNPINFGIMGEVLFWTGDLNGEMITVAKLGPNAILRSNKFEGIFDPLDEFTLEAFLPYRDTKVSLFIQRRMLFRDNTDIDEELTQIIVNKSLTLSIFNILLPNHDTGKIFITRQEFRGLPEVIQRKDVWILRYLFKYLSMNNRSWSPLRGLRNRYPVTPTSRDIKSNDYYFLNIKNELGYVDFVYNDPWKSYRIRQHGDDESLPKGKGKGEEKNTTVVHGHSGAGKAGDAARSWTRDDSSSVPEVKVASDNKINKTPSLIYKLTISEDLKPVLTVLRLQPGISPLTMDDKSSKVRTNKVEVVSQELVKMIRENQLIRLCDLQKQNCLICSDAIANCIAYPCYHRCCHSCWQKTLTALGENDQKSQCPICRSHIEELVTLTPEEMNDEAVDTSVVISYSPIHDNSFVYRLGDIVEADGFDTGSKICSNGLHGYLSVKGLTTIMFDLNNKINRLKSQGTTMTEALTRARERQSQNADSSQGSAVIKAGDSNHPISVAPTANPPNVAPALNDPSTFPSLPPPSRGKIEITVPPVSGPSTLPPPSKGKIEITVPSNGAAVIPPPSRGKITITAPPVSGPSTAPPVSVPSTAPPVSEPSTAPPASGPSTTPPVSGLSTAPSASGSSTAPSASGSSTVPLVNGLSAFPLLSPPVGYGQAPTQHSLSTVRLWEPTNKKKKRRQRKK